MPVTVEANDVFTLLWWWAAWTLADTYLIPFTPVSELAVLFACAAWWGVPKLAMCLARGRASMATGLQKVTQTSDV